MEVPPVQVQQSALLQLAGVSELGETSQPAGTSEVSEAPDQGGLDDFNSDSQTPLLLLGRGIPHQRRVTVLARSADQGGEGERGFLGEEHQPAPATQLILRVLLCSR